MTKPFFFLLFFCSNFKYKIPFETGSFEGVHQVQKIIILICVVLAKGLCDRSVNVIMSNYCANSTINFLLYY